MQSYVPTLNVNTHGFALSIQFHISLNTVDPLTIDHYLSHTIPQSVVRPSLAVPRISSNGMITGLDTSIDAFTGDLKTMRTLMHVHSLMVNIQCQCVIRQKDRCRLLSLPTIRMS